MNSENNKISDLHTLYTYRQNKRYVALSNFSFNYVWKNFKLCKKLYKTYKKLCKNFRFKYQLQRLIMNLNYLMDYILYQIFNIILIVLSKNMEQ